MQASNKSGITMQNSSKDLLEAYGGNEFNPGHSSSQHQIITAAFSEIGDSRNNNNFKIINNTFN
jgi:hypothetical protein